MSDKEYRSAAGFVQFDPRPREAAGKPVRDILIRAVGDHKQYSVTVWPSHGHIDIKKGDFVVVDGEYNARPAQTKTGEQVTYHNLSATYLIHFPANGTSEAPPAKQRASKKAAPAETEEASDDFDDLF
jgi:hypothetical protein